MDAILTQMTLINKSGTEVVSVTIPTLSVWLSSRLEHDYSAIQTIYTTDATNVAVVGSNKSRLFVLILLIYRQVIPSILC